jgi:peptidoglycan/LPS O-acetylase OafA/YrhL
VCYTFIVDNHSQGGQPPAAANSPPNRAAAARSNQPLLRWAAALSIGALLGHAIDVPDHLAEWWGFSSYFITAGAFQFFYGFGLLLQPWRYDDNGGLRDEGDRYGRPYYVLGLVLTASIVALYVVTRTTGMPFLGPEAAAERVTVLSLVPIAVDVPLIYCLAELLRRTRG